MMYGMYGYGMNGIHGMGWGMGLVWILGICCYDCYDLGCFQQFQQQS